ncbi:uncharacterized protein LOC141684516 isoform X2 [Apium graveolens]|uniref:uncharacterized protein LOC141684516 isoform X2 n=1 Tax=Apium graveolens TaxID=4045 RepID=UPI003D793AA7
MDETLQNSSTESMPKNLSCFTGCFRSSNKKLSKDMKAAASSSKNNKTTSLTFLSSFCVNKSAVQTKHVKAAVSEKPNRSTKDFTPSPNLDKKISLQKTNKQASGIDKTNFPAPAPRDNNNNKVHNHKKKNSEIGEENFTEKISKFEQSILLVKEGNRQTPKKEKKRSRSSSFGPLQVEQNIVPTKTTRVLSHSISLPPLIRTKEKAIRSENGVETQGKVDPIVGMSIMMGTLVIMIIWGKVCAIICTCAWLYMVPRLRTKKNSRLNLSSLNLESVEYKKKVVLEGLLQRDRRRVVGN